MRFKEYLKEPLIWMLAILLLGFVLGAGRIDAAGMKEGQVGVADSGKMIRLASVLIVGLLAFFTTVRNNSFRYVVYGANGWLFVFFLLCLASAVFSPLKTLTLFKSYEILVIILVLAVAYSSKDRYRTCKMFIIALMAMYVMTVIGVYIQFAIFGQEEQRQLVGVTPLLGFMLTSKYPGMVGNALGYLGAIVALFGIYLVSTHKNNNKSRFTLGSIIFLLGTGVTFLSYTRSVMVFLYMAIFILMAYKKKFIVNALMILLVALMLAIPQVNQKVMDHLIRGDSEQKLTTLSGRTEMWSAVFDRRNIKIIIGDGYATGARFMDYERTGKTLQHINVHNGFLEVVMSVGILGGVIWAGILLRIIIQFTSFYKRARYKMSQNDRNFHIFMLALLFLSIMRSIMNSTFVYLDYFYPVLMAFMLYGDALREKYHTLSMESSAEPSGKLYEESSSIISSNNRSILSRKI